jgi:beta-glucosidase
VRAQVPLGRRSFTVWDVAANDWLLPGGEYEILVGASSTDLRGSVTIHIESGDVLTEVPGPAGPVATDAEFEALLGRPIPVPPAQRPFTRLSTGADLETSALGRRLVAAMRWGIQRKLADTETGNTEHMVDAVLVGLPLRAFVMMSPSMSFGIIDRIIATLNNDLRGVLRPRRPRAGATALSDPQG